MKKKAKVSKPKSASGQGQSKPLVYGPVAKPSGQKKTE